MKKCVRYVEAMNIREVGDILTFNENNQPYDVMNHIS